MKTARDTVVTLHYTLSNDDGEVMESSFGGEPLTYLHGHNNIVSGLERALMGVATGHKAKVSVAAKDGYGERRSELVFEVPRDQLPPEMILATGAQVHGDGPNGAMPFTIVRLTDKGAILDGNHPLAGRTLHFEVEVVDVRAATHEELEHGHVHGPGHEHHH